MNDRSSGNDEPAVGVTCFERHIESLQGKVNLLIQLRVAPGGDDFSHSGRELAERLRRFHRGHSDVLMVLVCGGRDQLSQSASHLPPKVVKDQLGFGIYRRIFAGELVSIGIFLRACSPASLSP